MLAPRCSATAVKSGPRVAYTVTVQAALMICEWLGVIVRQSMSFAGEARAADGKAMLRTKHVRECESEVTQAAGPARCLKAGDDDKKNDDDDDDHHAFSSSRLLLVNVYVQGLVHLIIGSSCTPLLQCLHQLIQLANLLVYHSANQYSSIPSPSSRHTAHLLQLLLVNLSLFPAVLFEHLCV